MIKIEFNILYLSLNKKLKKRINKEKKNRIKTKYISNCL